MLTWNDLDYNIQIKIITLADNIIMKRYSVPQKYIYHRLNIIDEPENYTAEEKLCIKNYEQNIGLEIKEEIEKILGDISNEAINKQTKEIVSIS